MKIIKSNLKWLIIGLTLFFIITTFKQNWQQITTVKFSQFSVLMIFVSLILNILAHVFSAKVWTWILAIFHTRLQGLRAINVYLITNICKYLPGNIWHFYGRIKEIQNKGDDSSIAFVCVMIEPLLMAVSAFLISLISAIFGVIKIEFSPIFFLLILSVIGTLIIIHPKIINPILTKLAKNKGAEKSAKLTEYPLIPLGGETIFILLRGSAFICLFIPFMNLPLNLIPQVLSGFSFAWLLGLIIPGAPGGIGVFEATIISLFDSQIFLPQVILVVIALFRVTSILAELFTAGFAFLSNKFLKLD